MDKIWHVAAHLVVDTRSITNVIPWSKQHGFKRLNCVDNCFSGALVTAGNVREVGNSNWHCQNAKINVDAQHQNWRKFEVAPIFAISKNSDALNCMLVFLIRRLFDVLSQQKV